MRDFPPITKFLLAINVVIFVANQFGALPYTVSFPGIYSMGTLLSHFSHASFFHLVSNIIGIIIVSPTLEQDLGKKNYIILLLFLWFTQASVIPFLIKAPTLGFSGILLGLLTFFAIRLWVQTRNISSFTLGRDLLVLVGINVALPLLMPQISFVGHALGAGLGLIAAGFAFAVKRISKRQGF